MTASEPSEVGRPRMRPIAAAITGAVAVLGLVGGLVGFWTLDTASDSERFEARIEALLQEEEISDALASRVVTEVVDGVGLREAVDAAVPEVLRPAIDLLAAGVRSRLEDRMGELIRSSEVAAGVAAAAGRAHELTIDVIEGDTQVGGVQVDDGDVRINLLPLTARALTTLQEIGLLQEVAVPELERGGDPEVQRAELEAALGRDLPDEFGTPVVFRSDSLARAGDTVEVVRDVLVLARRTLWFLLVGGLALAALSIWLSARRWRTASFIVAGMFTCTLAIRIVLARASDRLPETVEQPGAQATVRQLATDLERSLNETMIFYSALGLLALGMTAAVHFDVVGRLRRRDD